MAKRQSKRERIQANPVIDDPFRDETQNFDLSSISLPRSEEIAPIANLAFVNLTDSSGPTQDAGKRKLVRAHVMREFQRQRQERDQRDFEIWKEQSQKGMLFRSVQPIPGSESIYEREDGEELLEQVYENLDWTTSFDMMPHQSEGQDFESFEQQIEGWPIWPPTIAEDEAKILSNGTNESSLVNTGFGFPLNFTYEQEQAFFESFDREDEPSAEGMVPEDIECPLISKSINAVSRNILDNGRLDPFDAMPGLRNARPQAVMYHYNKVLGKTLITVVDPRSQWFNYAISDSALFHATMLHSAAHNAMLAGNTNLADPLPFKWEATRLINERLDDPVLSISDLTIAAVVCLVLFENQEGNVELSNIHMNGLRKMIKLRGGLQGLGLAGVLRNKILWADAGNAILSLAKPRFNLLPEAKRKRKHPPNSPSNFTPSSTLSPTYDANLASCEKHLAEIIHSMRALSHTLSNRSLTKPIPDFVVDEIYLSQRRLVILVSLHHSAQHSASCDSVYHPKFLACLIYIYHFLRDYPVQAPLVGTFFERLVNSLFDDQSGEVRNEWKDKEMLIWVLVIGGLMSEGRCERRRIVRELGSACWVMSVGTFEELREVLRRIVWFERRDESTLRMLWSEVQAVGMADGVGGCMDEMME